MLDEVTGETPTIMISKDYHSAWLNSAALAVAGGDLDVARRRRRAGRGGRADGRSSARSRPGASATATCSRPRSEWVEATRAGVKLANSRGVVAIHDKDGWLGAPGIFQRLRDEGNLSLRVWGSIPHEQLDAAAALSLRSGFGDEFLRIGYLKCFMDGTLGSQTALMTDGTRRRDHQPRGARGDHPPRGAERGWPVGVHAIGDQANRNALDAFEATRDAWEPKGLRQRIEHAQCLAPEDLPRFAALGIACSVQFSHAPSDRDLADRLWADRLAGTYSFRSLLDSGAVVANGSDAPVEELDPIAGVAAGVLRSIDERPAWRPEETLTVEQALHATCVAPTLLSGDERRRGRLMPGCSPTSSCSIATRSPSSRRSCASCRSSRRWSAAAGCTTRRPGTEPRSGGPLSSGPRSGPLGVFARS